MNLFLFEIVKIFKSSTPSKTETREQEKTNLIPVLTGIRTEGSLNEGSRKINAGSFLLYIFKVITL